MSCITVIYDCKQGGVREKFWAFLDNLKDYVDKAVRLMLDLSVAFL